MQEKGDVCFSAEYYRLFGQLHLAQHPDAATVTLDCPAEVANGPDAPLFLGRIAVDRVILSLAHAEGWMAICHPSTAF